MTPRSTVSAKKTAAKAKRTGKAPTTQAGEFVREEMHQIGQGEREPKSAKQAIAIGLSKARRAGVKLPAPEPSKASAATRTKAKRDLAAGRAAAKKRRPARKGGTKKRA